MPSIGFVYTSSPEIFSLLFPDFHSKGVILVEMISVILCCISLLVILCLTKGCGAFVEYKNKNGDKIYAITKWIRANLCGNTEIESKYYIYGEI